ncbi:MULTISPECIES: ribonuclease III [Desulfococcus]|jgi:ribonuclease III|uniref:Ribonuclease 3 n=1 Tax=Desulfococcus multivorans DSM 2059 TaxID=1121405 RepID=S7TY49_DESML|nr:ribonuclease III [Desulfococcus multivorans]AQU99823.1 ribonuclease III [Desulfococcus multivorans]EPR42007.1 Ribonuclease 3 [Desulfococcus multivorans DSM 2059]MDX9818003.1 ribonuclease III [Desulfococcus multivorans]SKA10233.1 RNAse III [Desulfococcus multivorans DSM 2059]
MMKLSKLEYKIDYRFKNKDLLEEACRHSSFVNEQPETHTPGMSMRDNERLEFLGDAVLNLVVGHMLMDRYPEMPEGDLSRMRAHLVNESELASVAREIDLGDFLLLGKGESQSNGREKKSILADAFEAVIAAIYLDGGFDAAFHFVRGRFSAKVLGTTAPVSRADYKSRLQEIVQTTHKVMPTYQVIGESGPDHDKTFAVRITVCDLEAEGVGKSKKTAEQDAARRILKLLENCCPPR